MAPILTSFSRSVVIDQYFTSCSMADFSFGSKLPVRGAFGSRPLSGAKPKQILMIADSWAPTSAIGGTFPVAGGRSESLFIAKRGLLPVVAWIQFRRLI
jgi:hypothetical protein